MDGMGWMVEGRFDKLLMCMTDWLFLNDFWEWKRVDGKIVENE